MTNNPNGPTTRPPTADAVKVRKLARIEERLDVVTEALDAALDLDEDLARSIWLPGQRTLHQELTLLRERAGRARYDLRRELIALGAGMDL